MDVSLNGKYDVNVTGYAGSVGCCIDYYLVNESSEVSWSSATTPTLQSELSVIHLNSSVVVLQSTAGVFSFVPHSSMGYVVFFVNDNYPNATIASVNSDMILHYSSLSSLYWIIAGLFVFALGVSLLVLGVRRREKPVALPKKMNQTQTDKARVDYSRLRSSVSSCLYQSIFVD